MNFAVERHVGLQQKNAYGKLETPKTSAGVTKTYKVAININKSSMLADIGIR